MKEAGMLDRTLPSYEYETWLASAPSAEPAVQQAAMTREGHDDVPTLLLAAAIYGAFCAVTWFYQELAWWLVLPIGAGIVCLQSSLQHEAVHGYPTRWPWLNALIAAPILSLFEPYGIYRDDHLRHHVDENLTDPHGDPESNYLAPEAWAGMSLLHRRTREVMTSLVGRMAIGPIYLAIMSILRLARAVRTGDRIVLRHWALHAVALVVLAWWIVGVCGISPLDYVLLFAWPGTALTLIRSFAEHRWAPDVPARTATVEAGPVMSFLFLNNNLHALHHAEPALAWHERPRQYRARRNELLGDSRYHLIDGYDTLFRRYAFEAKEPLLHPAYVRRGPVSVTHKPAANDAQPNQEPFRTAA
jgi:fatty acid desaturase